MLFSSMAALPPDWSLVYERSGYVETGRYEEAVSYCRRLAKASPNARLIEYGVSPQGRKMVALLISTERKFDPKALASSKRPLIFVQNGIHSGEIEGKDASLILARRILVEGAEKAIAEGTNLLIVPIFSVDAHERFGPYNRINQNGPKEMGWRSTAQNLNLNRDWIKADAPEMQAQIRLVQKFRPDFMFDNHTTDGADYPYVLTLSVPSGPTLPPATATWQRRLYDVVKPRTDADSFLTSPYFSFIDPGDPSKGIRTQDFSPRYSHGYWSAMNRPSMLVETHVLKPYRQRVEGTYSVMKHTMEHCAREASTLKRMNRAADEAEGVKSNHVVLASNSSRETSPIELLTYPYTPYTSPISGGTIPKWDRTRTVRTSTAVYDRFVAGYGIDSPAAYAIPPEWKDVIDRVELHGLKIRRTKGPNDVLAGVFRFLDVTFAEAPFEGRFMPQWRGHLMQPEQTHLPAGTVIVEANQVGRTILIHMLEPLAPDSLLRWGLLNAIFEQKEYYEDYAMEPIAKEMLAKDEKLRAEFEARVKSDEAFAKSPRARLRWLFERSPYLDTRLNRYPIVRLNEEALRGIR